MPPTKSKRLIDVIGEQEKSQDWIVQRFKKLELSMKLHSDWNKPEGETTIDIGWVKGKIEEFGGGVVPNKEELDYANRLWKKYK